MDITRIPVVEGNHGLVSVNFAGQEREKRKRRLVEAIRVAKELWAEALNNPDPQDVEFDVTMSPAFNTILQQVIAENLTET